MVTKLKFCSDFEHILVEILRLGFGNGKKLPPATTSHCKIAAVWKGCVSSNSKCIASGVVLIVVWGGCGRGGDLPDVSTSLGLVWFGLSLVNMLMLGRDSEGKI